MTNVQHTENPLNMLERVARALTGDRPNDAVEWTDGLDAARAAIEAMREPTDVMVDAAKSKWDEWPQDQLDEPAGFKDEAIREMHAAMIDVALEDK